MASSQLDGVVISFECNHKQIFVCLFLRSNTLQQNIGLFGPLHNEHIILLILPNDLLGVGHLTNLTLEPLKVILIDDPVALLANLILNPLLQALEMHRHTRPLTITRRDQKVMFLLLITQTEFARPTIHSVGLVDLKVGADAAGTHNRIIGSVFEDAVLEPTEFYGVAQLEGVALLLVLVVFEAADHQVRVVTAEVLGLV